MSKSPLSRTLLDAVPEMYHYEDTGCEVSLSCLNCPLPRCKYDDPVWFQRYRRMGRDLKVWRTIHSERLTAEEAAQRFSVTVRTVFRIMRRCRESLPEMNVEEMGALAAD